VDIEEFCNFRFYPYPFDMQTFPIGHGRNKKTHNLEAMKELPEQKLFYKMNDSYYPFTLVLLLSLGKKGLVLDEIYRKLGRQILHCQNIYRWLSYFS
jgi:hypothetical protein